MCAPIASIARDVAHLASGSRLEPQHGSVSSAPMQRPIYHWYDIVSERDLTRAARQLDEAAGIVPGIVRTGTSRTATNDPGDFRRICGAGDGDRTRDIRLGKPAFYR